MRALILISAILISSCGGSGVEPVVPPEPRLIPCPSTSPGPGPEEACPDLPNVGDNPEVDELWEAYLDAPAIYEGCRAAYRAFWAARGVCVAELNAE